MISCRVDTWTTLVCDLRAVYGTGGVDTLVPVLLSLSDASMLACSAPCSFGVPCVFMVEHFYWPQPLQPWIPGGFLLPLCLPSYEHPPHCGVVSFVEQVVVLERSQGRNSTLIGISVLVMVYWVAAMGNLAKL